MSAFSHHETQAIARAATQAIENKTDVPREYLSFHLGCEAYGIDILRVKEIRSHEQPTRLTGAPAFVAGVINLRGAMVPVVDLRLRFGLPEAPCDRLTVVVVLNVRDRIVGAVVDSVSDVLELHADQIKQAPQFNAQVQAGHIVGIASVTQAQGDRMLILLDIEALMSSAELGLFEAAH